MILAFALASALAADDGGARCKGPPLKPFVRKSTRGLTLSVSPGSSTLTDSSGKELWTLPIDGWQALFAPDESWVAIGPHRDFPGFTIIRTKAKAEPRQVNVLLGSNEDELFFQGASPWCRRTFRWQATSKGVELPAYNLIGSGTPAKEAMISVDVDGRVTRNFAPLVVDIAALAKKLTPKGSPERVSVLRDIEYLARTPSGRRQAAELVAVVERVLKSGVGDNEEVSIAHIITALDDPERTRLIELALKQDRVVEPMLSALTGDEQRRHAEPVFRDKTRSGDVRSWAFRRGDAAGCSTWLLDALADSDPEVHRAGVSYLTTCGDCSASFLDAVLAHYRKELAAPRGTSDYDTSAYNGCFLRCMGRGAPTEPHARLANALGKSFQLDPHARSTPLIYLILAAWAERGAPQRAAGFLDDAERTAGNSDYYFWAVQWRMLRALKSGDRATAKSLLPKLQPAIERKVNFPDRSPSDVGTSIDFEPPMLFPKDFIARMERELGQ